MSTSVPSHGSARRARNVASPSGQRAFMEEQQPAHALGDVPAGERRTGNIANVGVETHRVSRVTTVSWKDKDGAERTTQFVSLQGYHKRQP